MLKSLFAACAIAALVPATAAAAPLTAKVAVVDKPHVCLVLNGKPEAWVKKGANVRVFGGKAKVVNIAGDTLCVTTSNAAKAKPGATVPVEKPRPGAAGC